jgi:hypothetical protein
MSRVKTIHIGDKDIYEWTMGEGKSVMMPIILKSANKLMNSDLDEVRCLRVEAVIRGNSKAFDFYVKRKEIRDTLSKIMEWALEEEEYEMCNEVKRLNEKLEHF